MVIDGGITHGVADRQIGRVPQERKIHDVGFNTCGVFRLDDDMVDARLEAFGGRDDLRARFDARPGDGLLFGGREIIVR